MFIKTTMKYLFTPSRMAIIGQSDQFQVFVTIDRQEPFLTAHGNLRLNNLFGKQSSRPLRE